MKRDCVKDNLTNVDDASQETLRDTVVVNDGRKSTPFSPGALAQGKNSAQKNSTKKNSAKRPNVHRPVKKVQAQRSEYIRAENEDDDGYDPYSDRRPEPEPLFERDPWM